MVLISAIIYGLVPIASKLSYADGATPYTLLLVRMLNTPFLFLIAKRQTKDMSINKREVKNIALLALFGGLLTPLCTLNAHKLLPAGTATTLHYMYCVIIVLICVLVFKDPFDKIKGLSVVMCVTGVFLLYGPSSAQGNSALGFTLAIISAFTYAIYTVTMEKTGMHSMNPFKLILYRNLMVATVLIIYGLATGNLAIHLTTRGWIIAIFYYMICELIANAFYLLGVHYVGSQTTAILSTFEPMTSVIVGILLFNEAFSLRIFLSVLIILSATILVSLFGTKYSPAELDELSKADLNETTVSPKKSAGYNLKKASKYKD